MDEIKQWTVTIDIDEHDGHTRAVARLLTRDPDRLTGVGLSRLDPADRDVPEIGDEIAALLTTCAVPHGRSGVVDRAPAGTPSPTRKPVRSALLIPRTSFLHCASWLPRTSP